MCIGPLKRMCHWGPLVALGIVKCVSFTMWHCSSMWWPPFQSLGGMLNFLIFTMWNALTLFNFFNAMIVGPGYIPLGWQPENPDEKQYLQYCNFCLGYKAPRAHHCRKCNRCVMKMDHHCPWINNCCGHKNHCYFTLFLLCAVCGCFHASIVIACSLYRALNRTWYLYYGTGNEPLVHLGIYGFIFGMFSLGLALGVVIAVGTLFYIQAKGIIKNETVIESWIVAKSVRPRPPGDIFIYPYNLGWVKNLQQVFTWNFEPKGNGITWKVVDGCNQYTLTIEQIKQKEEKRLRTKEYMITEDFSGSWCPITKGFKVFFSPPISDEPRIKLKKDDKVMVTRWKRHWLYGEKIIDEQIYSRTGSKVRVRGWFPRRCAVEIMNGDIDYPRPSVTEKGDSKKVI